MPNQESLDIVYLGVAKLHANLSKALRKKVGACIVTNNGIIIPGYNGTPSGQCNACERAVADSDGNLQLVTKASVIHAELNCILKAAREGVSVVNSVLYSTLAPCLQCSSMIIQSGIRRVVYSEQYRSTEGLELLHESNIELTNLS